MNYSTAHIAATLKATRETKGLSQRALAKLAGVPQSYVSRIESGAIDLRLSSLVELARALDLELTLVPRISLPAVQSIARTHPSHAMASDTVSAAKELRRLQERLSELAQATPGLIELAQLQRMVRDLRHMQVSEPNVADLRKASKVIRAFKPGEPDSDAIRQALTELQNLRNRLVHAAPETGIEKPAYSLEDDDHE